MGCVIPFPSRLPQKVADDVQDEGESDLASRDTLCSVLESMAADVAALSAGVRQALAAAAALVELDGMLPSFYSLLDRANAIARAITVLRNQLEDADLRTLVGGVVTTLARLDVLQRDVTAALLDAQDLARVSYYPS